MILIICLFRLEKFKLNFKRFYHLNHLILFKLKNRNIFYFKRSLYKPINVEAVFISQVFEELKKLRSKLYKLLSIVTTT